MGPVLEVESVTKLYGDFKAVNDLSFSLEPGIICGFLGPNGAGKTTTIRMVLDIIRPTSGRITLLGSNSARQVRERIGYLPEEKGLYKKMKAWAIIAYFATLKGMSSRAAKQRACELLECYGLKDFTEKRTEALSKGMAQKVQVLASIAHDPEFVILDEPFSGLDPVNQQVLEQIVREMAARGRTILFSTHVMQHAERLCERIILMAGGRKIFDGSVPAAKRKLPRRVLLETTDDISRIRDLDAVVAINAQPNGEGKTGRFEVEIRDDAEASNLLEACFERGIRLRSFNSVDPTLHDVFVHLVGPEAREATFR